MLQYRMGILIPSALALLALAVPIVAFYMLRLRRGELPVASSLLWQRAVQDRTANAPWQRLRRNLLLLLQLLLLLLLVLTLARPFIFTEGAVSGNLVVVLDASASMRSVDEDKETSRFGRALREANALVDDLPRDRKMSIIWAGPQPFVAAPATSSKTDLRTYLSTAVPSNGTTNMVAALTLAAASARQLGDATVVLISDGALLSDGNLALPQVPARALYINVGKSARNLAITALSLRDTPSGPELFASVSNSGQTSAGTLLSIKVDGALREARRIQIQGRAESVVTLDGLPLTTRLVTATLSSDEAVADLLPTDNQAWALRSRPPLSDLLLVSAGNGFLEKSLNLLPNTKLFKVAPGQYNPASSYALTIFDAYLPPQLPVGNLLIFAPPNFPLLPVSGTIQYPAIGPVEINDPLMRFVDLSHTHIAQAQRITPPQWMRVLVRATTGEPLVLVGETGGRRIAVIAFDLHQSDLPLQVAFPILTSNLVEWLRPAASVAGAQSVNPGNVISIAPQPEADEVDVTLPTGGITTLHPSGSSPLLFAGTDDLGVYTLQQKKGGNALGEPDRFAVNLFSKDESDITPNPKLAFTGSEATPQQGATNHHSESEIWPWVLLASLALLSAEWWFYNRSGRLRVPRLRANKQ